MGATFEADLSAFARKIGKTLDQTKRGIVIKLFSAVIADTPVDIGFLRGAWNLSVGSPDFTRTGNIDKSGMGQRAILSSAIIKAGTVQYYTNPLPYAVVAEYGLWNGPTEKVTAQGYSRKSPAGMVRRNMARVHAIVSSAATDAKGVL